MKKWQIILLPVLLLSACGEADPKEVNFSLKEVGEVDFHTADQIAFWADKNVESSLLAYGMGEETKDLPTPIKLDWKVPNAKKYIVKVSEKEDMSNSWSFETKKKAFDLYNCKIGTKYYWTVTAEYKSNSFTSPVATFTTKVAGPRNLIVDGLNNIRDIGGFTTNEGKIVKQGLMYRSAKMNESDVAKVQVTISNKGIETMKNQLGIKTDIDLRKTDVKDGASEIGGLVSSPLGEDVNYVNCPMYYEGSSVISHPSKSKKEVNQASVKKMFDLMADKNNYPMVFHCTQGKDRTGAMAYLLETLLGMDKNDIYHDYLFTNMSKVGGYCNYSQFEKYEDVLRTYGGDTLQEQAYNYLIKIGVSAENIANIKDIFLA